MDEFTLICAAVRASYARVGRPGCVIAALSGGADSVLLLRALRTLREETPFELRVVHVNHGLRENAALDRDLLPRAMRQVAYSACGVSCTGRFPWQHGGCCTPRALRGL